MAKGGLANIRKKHEQGNNVNNENNKSLKSDNVIETKEHRLVIDIPEDLYWKFKTTSGMRKQKMKESIEQAITQWIENA